MAAALQEEKYRNAILYFAKHIDNGTLGKVKLMKLLYYLDFDHFEQYGTSVTGDEYVHLQMGPVPIHAKDVLNRMALDGQIKILHKEVGMAYPQTQYLKLQDYKPDAFLPSELDVLSNVVMKWEHHSGSEMVRAVHGDPPWLMTDYGAIIDYKLTAFRRSEDALAETDEEEPTMNLTPEEETLRAEGLALVKKLEALAESDPEFSRRVQARIDEIEAGHYVLFDEAGWQNKL